VGKSRLVYEFLHAHHTQGWLVLESASGSYGKATPYFPVIDLLRRYSHVEDRDEGKVLGEDGLQRVETGAHPSSLMWASHGIGLWSLCQGDLSRALPLLERAMGICQEAALLLFVPRVAAALGAVYILSGRVADAVVLLTPVMTQTRAADMTVFQALCNLPLGEAHLLTGRLEEAQALTRAHQELGNQAYALRFLGDIAARRHP
jgi:hypothetical protein